MIGSKFFWAGILLLVVIPFVVMDIPKHYVDWKREVKEETYLIIQNDSSYTTGQKDEALDNVFAANKKLMALIVVKSFAGFLLFCFSIYFLLLYVKYQKQPIWKVFLICCILVICSAAIKFYLWTSFAGDQKIKLLTLSPSDTTLSNIYNANFKGKLLYVDFWGTNCGPCIDEFINFTKPLKQRFQNRKDIAYLYVGSGHLFIWKQQLQKFDIEGSHILLGAADFRRVYAQAVKGSKDTREFIPRYVIINKKGNIVEPNAYSPGEKDLLYQQLDKYLAIN